MLLVLLVLGSVAFAQAPDPVEMPRSNHILGFIPNYKPVPNLSSSFVPLDAKTKFKYATLDSFDPYWWGVAGVYAGLSQLDNRYREFGQGGQGYAKRYGVAFADQAIRNYITEGILPSVLHEDIRYFRLARGGAWKRIGYAITGVLVTHSDAGH